MSNRWAERKRTLMPLVREASKLSCATCKGWPWECQCRRTALDLSQWLMEIAHAVEDYVQDNLEQEDYLS